MAGGDGKKHGAGGGGLMQLLIPLVAVTVLGGGGGGFLGFSLLAPKEPAKTDGAGETGNAAPPKESADAHGGGHAKSDGHGGGHDKEAEHKPEAPPTLQVKELPPVVTNLAGSAKSWVRLQSAIVYDPHELPHVETLVPELMSDITAFINTLDLSSIEGPDGLRRLQEELNERAAIRSDRHVRELIVETLVVQ